MKIQSLFYQLELLVPLLLVFVISGNALPAYDTDDAYSEDDGDEFEGQGGLNLAPGNSPFSGNLNVENEEEDDAGEGQASALQSQSEVSDNAEASNPTNLNSPAQSEPLSASAASSSADGTNADAASSNTDASSDLVPVAQAAAASVTPPASSDPAESAAAASISASASSDPAESAAAASISASASSDPAGSAAAASISASDPGQSLIANSDPALDIGDSTALKRSSETISAADSKADLDVDKGQETIDAKRSLLGQDADPCENQIDSGLNEATCVKKREARKTNKKTWKLDFGKGPGGGNNAAKNKLRRKFPLTFCDLPRDNGIICPGIKRGSYIDQFYYDPSENRCNHFVYNGCGGNANRFSSLWECTQSCSVKNYFKPKLAL